jgi:hypothetical protein
MRPCRWFAALALAATLPLATAQEAAPPILSAQLALRAGQVVPVADQSKVDFGAHRALFEACGIDEARAARELSAWLGRHLAAQGRLPLQLALVGREGGAAERRGTASRLQALAGGDATTAALQGFTGAWREANAPVNAWVAARQADAADLVPSGRTLNDLYVQLALNDAGLADGPLLPRTRDADSIDARDQLDGRVQFRISPPLRGLKGKLRPTANVAQWSAWRGELGADVLDRYECSWFEPAPMLALMQDVLELRGVAVEGYRTLEDQRAAADLGAARDKPLDRAAIRFERPEVQKQDGGGRIHLDPDPHIDAVYVVGTDLQRTQQALYLLLPTSDADRIRHAPEAYLCRGEAVWQVAAEGQALPPAVQLPLDGAMPALRGSGLRFAQTYLTRRTLADRVARLGALEFEARLDLAREYVPAGPRQAGVNPLRRAGLLLLEPRANAQAASATDRRAFDRLPPCTSARDRRSAAASPPVLAAQDPPQPARLSKHQARRAAERVLRNDLELSLEHRAGKPLLFGALYRHRGPSPDQTFSIGFGQQKQQTGEFSLSGDFLAFEALGRRLSWSATAWSRFDPERGIDAGRPDERRRGAELRFGLDLWRDMPFGPGGSFGRSDIALAREETQLSTAAAPATEQRRIEIGLAAAGMRDGTPAAPRWDAALDLMRGRSGGDSYNAVRIDAGWQQFFGLFSRWDLRLRAHAIGAAAPVTEWPVFGGDEGVRGYRSDRVAARRIAVLRSEAWLPLPWPTDSPSTERLFRRQLNLAAFADLGHVDDPAIPFERRAAGIGLGLRYAQGDALVLKFDLARPLRADAPPDRKLRIHFSVATRPTL